MQPYTYLIKFKPTGQCYYGSRFKNVRLGISPQDDLMIKYFTSSKDINDLIAKYGLEAFEWEVRKTFATAEQATDWETRVLKRCKVLESKKWFNGNIAGYILPTEESRKKISDYHKDKPKSDEHKQKIRDAQKGKPKKSTVYQSDEYRKQMSLLKSGAGNGMYGKGCTPERAAKIGAANKGKVPSNKGVPMTEEQKQKLSEKMKGRKVDPEVLARRVASQTGQKRQKLYCPHCNRDIAQGWFYRHGDACSQKQ